MTQAQPQVSSDSGSGKQADEILKKRLAELVTIAREKGSDHEDVKVFVRKHKEIPDFKELAATLLLLMATD